MQSEKESTIVRRILQHRQSHVHGVAFAKTAHVARQRLCVFLPFQGENFLTTMGMKQLSHIRIANDTKHRPFHQCVAYRWTRQANRLMLPLGPEPLDGHVRMLLRSFFTLPLHIALFSSRNPIASEARMAFRYTGPVWHQQQLLVVCQSSRAITFFW